MHISSPRRRPTGAAAPSRRQLLGAGLAAAGVPVLSSCFGLGDTSGLVLEQPGGETPPEFEGRQRVVLWSSFTAHNRSEERRVGKAGGDRGGGCRLMVDVKSCGWMGGW